MGAQAPLSWTRTRSSSHVCTRWLGELQLDEALGRRRHQKLVRIWHGGLVCGVEAGRRILGVTSYGCAEHFWAKEFCSTA